MNNINGLILNQKIDTNIAYCSEEARRIISDYLNEIGIEDIFTESDKNSFYEMLTDAILMSLNKSKYFSKGTFTLDYKDYPDIEDFRSTDKKLIDELGKFFNYKHNRKRGIESTFEIDCLYIKFFEKICQPKWSFTLKKYVSF